MSNRQKSWTFAIKYGFIVFHLWHSSHPFAPLPHLHQSPNLRKRQKSVDTVGQSSAARQSVSMRKVLSNASGFVKLDLVTINYLSDRGMMEILIACLAHHLFLSRQLLFAFNPQTPWKVCSQRSLFLPIKTWDSELNLNECRVYMLC